MQGVLITFLSKKFKIDAGYFLRGGFWLTIGQFASLIIGLVTAILFANILNEHDYGIYKYLLALGTILSAFSLSGLGQSILQAAAKGYSSFYKETLEASFKYNLIASAFAVIGFSYYLWQGNDLLAWGCALIAITHPITNSLQFVPSVLQGEKRFKQSTYVVTIKSLFVSIFSVVTLLIYPNILALLSSYLITHTIINTFFHFKFVDSFVSKSIPAIEKKRLFAYARHTSVQNLISIIAHRIDAVIIFTQLGSAQLAIYTIALIVPEQLKGSFKNIASMFPARLAVHSAGSFKKMLPYRSLQLGLILIFITIIYILSTKLIYEILFPTYHQAILLSQLFALTFFSYIYYIPLSYLQGKVADRMLYKFHLSTSLLQIIVTPILTIAFGLLGAVISKIIIQYIRMITAFILAWKFNDLLEE